MPFINGKTMLEHARKNKYGIGAFSAHNAETIQAILWAAEEEQAPVMIQVGQKVIQYIGLEEMKKMIELFARDVTIPICIHLDHQSTICSNGQSDSTRVSIRYVRRIGTRFYRKCPHYKKGR